MARNEEKHYGRLNRLYLMKEKEEYEKANPQRPRLNTLYTSEEIQEWLPSIKKDIDFYLKKSQVTCYSDAHVEDCREKVVKLEREFKAFVRKMKQLAPSPLEVIPWTSRPYKRKKSSDDSEENSVTEFKRIATPLLDERGDSCNRKSPISDCCGDKCNGNCYVKVDLNLMDQPLNFSLTPANDQDLKREKTIFYQNTSDTSMLGSNLGNVSQHASLKISNNQKGTQNCCLEKYDKRSDNQSKKNHSIVAYDSSDSEDL